MKKLIMLILVLAVAASIFVLAGCGGTEGSDQDASAVTGEASDTTEAAQIDTSNPSVVIEYGDADAIEALAKQAQNFEVEEGTVVKISGIFSTGFSNPSVMEEKADDSKVGITMYVDGDYEAPLDGDDIEVVGHFVKGTYFMEFHVDPSDITVK